MHAYECMEEQIKRHRTKLNKNQSNKWDVNNNESPKKSHIQNMRFGLPAGTTTTKTTMSSVYYIAKSTLQMVWIAKFKGRLWTNKKRIEFPNLIIVLQLSYGLIHRFAQLLLLDKKQFQLFLAIYIQFYLIRTDGTILCVSFIEQGYFIYVLRFLCKFIASRS